MRTEIVFTLTGPDRVGIVEEVTGVLLELGGNVGSGRMARLGGEFTMLMLVSLPEGGVSEVGRAFSSLTDAGYTIGLTHTTPDSAAHGEGTVYRVDVRGADHEGIIHEIARGLAARGINIESPDTGTVEAPVTGVPLFFMSALVRVPSQLDEAAWLAALDEAARLAGVDVEVTAEDGV